MNIKNSLYQIKIKKKRSRIIKVNLFGALAMIGLALAGTGNTGIWFPLINASGVLLLAFSFYKIYTILEGN